MKKQQNKIVALLLTGCLLSFNGMAQVKSLSLEEVKNLALRNNKKVQQSQKHIDAANAALASANTAGKPTVDGSVMGIYLSGPLNTMLPEVQASASLAATQVLYAGGKIQNSKKLASSALDIQQAQKSLTEDEVLLQAESSYWTIVNLKEKKVLAEKYLDLLNALHKSLKNAFDAGLTYKNDLLKVEVKQNEAALNIVRLEDGLTMAKMSLAQTIGTAEEIIDIEDQTISKDLQVVANDETIGNRPEIEMLTKAVAIQDLKTELLKGDIKPTVVLGAYGVSAFGKHVNFKNGKDAMPFFAGMVSVNVPILDWGSRKHKVTEQQFKVDAQKIALTETQELLTLEVKDAKLKLNQSLIAISLAEKSLKQAEENLRLNEDRLSAGTVVGEDVLEAQVLWQGAYANLIDAKAAYKINEAKYKKALGNY